MARKASGQVVERQRDRGRVYALRFRAYGRRHYITLGTSAEGWTRRKAESELDNVLADVRRGIWRPPEPEPEVELPQRVPTFHEFASEWFELHEHEWSKRTVEDYRWALSVHLLPFFAGHRLDRITAEEVDRYRAAKVREGILSNNSINKTLTRLSQVLEAAVEYGRVESNAARGKKRRCKASTPRRASMGVEQVTALLDAAGRYRALLATAIMAGGLRVSELTGLRWRDVNLAAGTLTVAASKTEAGVRQVELDATLRDELAVYRAACGSPAPDAFVFPGRDGERRDRHAVRNRVLYPAIERANVLLEKRGLATIPDGTDGRPRVTFHSLRRTFASIAAEAGADPAWTASQIGHRDSRFTLNVYTDVGNRRAGAAERVGAFIRGGDWAPLGTTADFEGSAPELPVADSPLESA